MKNVWLRGRRLVGSGSVSKAIGVSARNSTVGGGGTSKVHWGSGKALHGGGCLLGAGVPANFGGTCSRKMPVPAACPYVGGIGAEADACDGAGW